MSKQGKVYIKGEEISTEGTMQEEYDKIQQRLKESAKVFGEEMNRLCEDPSKKCSVWSGTAAAPDPDDDMVNNPSHYQSMDGVLNIDCITAMQAAFGRYETAVFCKLNAFKYIWRASSKNGNEDIDKASWYLNKYKELGGENQ